MDSTKVHIPFRALIEVPQMRHYNKKFTLPFAQSLHDLLL